MVVVHPAFDPTTKTWFTDEGYEAASLGELKQKVPGIKIVGYYPHGAPRTDWSQYADKDIKKVGLHSDYRGPKRQLEAFKTQARLAISSSERLASQVLDSPKLELFSREPQINPVKVPEHDPLLKKLTDSLVKSGQILPSVVTPKPKVHEKKVLSPVQARQTLRHRPRQKVKQPPAIWDVRRKQPWTDEDDAELKSLAMQGLSAGVIGKEMKVTRNAVIGRAHRLGVRLGRVR